MSGSDNRALVHVVAAAIINAAGLVLIAQRPAGKHLAGGWEFPGGKLEPGEDRIVGLARELNEELGISIATPRPLMRVCHAYPTREVLLDIWVVKSYRGEPHGLDGQSLRWCSQQELATAELLQADKPIVAALCLPERVTQTCAPYYEVIGFNSLGTSKLSPAASSPSRLLGVFCACAAEAKAAADAGMDFVVMRDALTRDELSALCALVPIPLYARGIELEEAWTLGASGLNGLRMVTLPEA